MDRTSGVLSVSQLTNAIKWHLEGQFKKVVVEGEISNLSKPASGHLYFSLKDVQAQISVAMFRQNAASVKPVPKEGDKVIIMGSMNVYPKRGNYQIIAEELRYSGIGALLLQFQELKEKLQKRGWFDKEHKKSLPPFPKTIGVVTSATGAVIQDILNILERRHSGFHVILNPVTVQGEGAAASIAQAIDDFNRYQMADVLIVGRGGGSVEDLWAFNEEIVVKSIFESNIPIISAVGHETDTCLSDYAADVRAPTPSAAAELVLSEKQQILLSLSKQHKSLSQALKNLIRKDFYCLKGLYQQPVLMSASAFLGDKLQGVDDCQHRLDTWIKNSMDTRRLKLLAFRKQKEALNPIMAIQKLKKELQQWHKRLQSTLLQQLSRQQDTLSRHVKDLNQVMHIKTGEKKEKFTRLLAHLQSIDPKNLLKKGYSILFDEKKDSAIVSIKCLPNGQDVRMVLSDGEALATIKELSFEHTKSNLYSKR